MHDCQSAALVMWSLRVSGRQNALLWKVTLGKGLITFLNCHGFLHKEVLDKCKLYSLIFTDLYQPLSTAFMYNWFSSNWPWMYVEFSFVLYLFPKIISISHHFDLYLSPTKIEVLFPKNSTRIFHITLFAGAKETENNLNIHQYGND